MRHSHATSGCCCWAHRRALSASKPCRDVREVVMPLKNQSPATDPSLPSAQYPSIEQTGKYQACLLRHHFATQGISFATKESQCRILNCYYKETASKICLISIQSSDVWELGTTSTMRAALHVQRDTKTSWCFLVLNRAQKAPRRYPKSWHLGAEIFASPLVNVLM